MPCRWRRGDQRSTLGPACGTGGSVAMQLWFGRAVWARKPSAQIYMRWSPLRTAGLSLLHRVALDASADSQMAMPAELTDTNVVKGPWSRQHVTHTAC